MRATFSFMALALCLVHCGAGAGDGPTGTGAADSDGFGAGISQGGGGFAECASKTVLADEVPLELVLVQDRSSSMEGSKWNATVLAIKSFADNPGAAGVHAGLTYFPSVVADQCAVSSYSALDVSIAELPGNAPQIKESLYTTAPSGGTPMRPALEGGIEALRGRLMGQPDHVGAVVLVTDGDPTGCDDNLPSDVADLAKDAFEATPSVPVFVIGMDGASFTTLDDIAERGGTEAAFDVGDGADELLAALSAIEHQALACEYEMPVVDPEEEGILDPRSVIVSFAPGTAEPPVDIALVDQAEDCSVISGGFFYDDPTEPTRILLCDASCDLVRRGDTSANVTIVLGCILPPAE